MSIAAIFSEIITPRSLHCDRREVVMPELDSQASN